MIDELYVVVDSVTGDFVVGGGSSSPSYIRAFNNPTQAERSAKKLPRWGLKGDPIVVRFFREVTDE